MVFTINVKRISIKMGKLNRDILLVAVSRSICENLSENIHKGLTHAWREGGREEGRKWKSERTCIVASGEGGRVFSSCMSF